MAKVLFLQNDYFNWLGVMWLSAVIKKHGHECRLVRVFTEKQAAKAVKQHEPDLVAMHTMTGAHRFAIVAAAAAKAARPEVKVILGGPHATFFPDIINQTPVDFICRGEGEDALLELCNRLDAKRPVDDIPNLWVKQGREIAKNEVRPLIGELDSLPFPDREIYLEDPSKPIPIAYFMAGRGCPYNCSMCFNEKNKELYKGKGAYVRWRSPENVIAEIEEVRRRYGIVTVRFEDDTFTLSRKWSREFLERYRDRVALPFFAGTRADVVDRETAGQLKAAGCFMMCFSVESGSERVRNGILRKNISTEAIRNAAQYFHGVGLPFLTANILGIPGETVEEGFETLRLNIEIGTDSPWFSVFQPYPSTTIEENVKKEWGLDNLNPDMISDNYHSWSLLDNDPTVRQLANLHKFGFWAIKFPAGIPLARQLIKLPPNPAFIVIHRAAHLFIYARGARLPLWKGVYDGLRVSLAPGWFSMLEKFH